MSDRIEAALRAAPGYAEGSHVQLLASEVLRLRCVLANEVKHHVAKIEELARFKDWQPSDPGTKEAMEWAESPSWGPKYRRLGKVLTDSLRAAMVRLEEAEKENARLLENAKACAEGDCHEDSVPRSRYDVACDQYNECEKERKRLFDRCRELEARPYPHGPGVFPKDAAHRCDDLKCHGCFDHAGNRRKL